MKLSETLLRKKIRKILLEEVALMDKEGGGSGQKYAKVFMPIKDGKFKYGRGIKGEGPIRGKKSTKGHKGWDFGAGIGNEIRAVADGTVRAISKAGNQFSKLFEVRKISDVKDDWPGINWEKSSTLKAGAYTWVPRKDRINTIPKQNKKGTKTWRANWHYASDKKNKDNPKAFRSSDMYIGIPGNYISIEHDNISGVGSFTTRYLHLDKIAIKGGKIKAGQVIGTSGHTGQSTGPHLHFVLDVKKIDENGIWSKNWKPFETGIQAIDKHLKSIPGIGAYNSAIARLFSKSKEQESTAKAKERKKKAISSLQIAPKKSTQTFANLDGQVVRGEKITKGTMPAFSFKERPPKTK